MANVGLAPREVRIVILTVGLILAGDHRAARASPTPPARTRPGCSAGPALGLCLGLITVLATITTIQRILHVVRQPTT